MYMMDQIIHGSRSYKRLIVITMIDHLEVMNQAQLNQQYGISEGIKLKIE
jgi:hypothetical protein